MAHLLVAWLWPAYLYLGLVGLLAAWIDARSGLIPNWLTGPSYPLLLGLLALSAGQDHDWPPFGRAVAGGLVLSLGYLVLAALAPGQIGLGDVKLAGLLGLGLARASWAAWLVGVGAGFTFGAIQGLVLLAKGKGPQHHFPYGPALSLGALTGLLIG